MISKSLLKKSLTAIYKELLLEEESKESKKTKEEIWVAISNKDFFTKEEIIKNQKEFNKLKKLVDEKEFVCYTDGALVVAYDDEDAKTGKKVHGGSAFVVYANDKVLFENSFSIPSKYGDKDTNSHIAEYQAVISCLRVLSIYHDDPSIVTVTMHSDAEVLVNQMNQKFRVRDNAQRELKEEATELAGLFKEVKFVHIGREKNQRANELAKKSVDSSARNKNK